MDTRTEVLERLVAAHAAAAADLYWHAPEAACGIERVDGAPPGSTTYAVPWAAGQALRAVERLYARAPLDATTLQRMATAATKAAKTRMLQLTVSG